MNSDNSISNGNDRPIDLSLIVPCYNEEKNIPLLLDAVETCFSATDLSVECVFVDDGSKDDTASVLCSLVSSPNQYSVDIQTIILSRNFGKEAALYAGLEYFRGNCCCFMDADMQQLPEDALRMYRILQENPFCDIVAACQTNRKESAPLRLFKHTFYRTFNTVVDEVELPANVSDFRVFRRKVAEALLSLPETDRFGKGLFAWVGFSSQTVAYEPSARANGKSGWSFGKLMKYALNGIFSFTTWPLKVSTWIGSIASVGSLLFLLSVLIEYLVKGTNAPGYSTLACLITLFGGLQLVALGIIGEYVARIFIDGKRRPVYLAKETGIKLSAERDEQ